MMDEKLLWEKCGAFHGHICPGLAIGFKASLYAMKLLELDFSEDEQIACISENDACGVDAVQVLLGCSAGKGNLLFHLTGKMAFSFYNRGTGRSVRLVLKAQEKAESRDEKLTRLLATEPKALFDVMPTRIALPEEARLFGSIRCDGCGEMTAESYIHLQNGKRLCPDCYRPSLSDLNRGDIARRMTYEEQQSERTQLTVFDAVLLGRKPYIKMRPTEEDYDITRRAIARMELEPLQLRYVDELSGGEMQKVVLARALAQQPKVMLLDEPTSNLDLYNQHEVMRVVSQIAREDGMAVIVVIHDLNLALRYCDRFLLMRGGEVYCYGGAEVITEEALAAVYRVKAEIHEIGGRRFVMVE